MALVNRLARLFRADMHAVLDQIEEPELLLRQAIRDMEDELRAAESSLNDRQAEQEAVIRRLGEIVGAIEEHQSELDLCLGAGNERLARHLIRRKLEAERLVSRLEGRQAENADWIAAQTRQIDENRLALESLRQKSEVLSESLGAGASVQFDESNWAGRDLRVSDDDVEIALLREIERRAVT